MKKSKITFCSLLVAVNLYCQQSLKTDGNVLNSTHFAGSTNNQDFNIKANNQLRFKFGTGFENINYGLLSTDSFLVQGNARIKGVLKVGLNSLSLAGGPFGGSDFITSSNGVIAFGGGAPFTSFPDIRIGMGIQNPVSNLHISDSRTPSNAVRALFTNTITGLTVSDGFQTGIFSNGWANFNQQETNLPITLTTAGGFVGVSNSNLLFNPQSLFHISDGAAATYAQITNNATGFTATDGVRLGILANGIGILNQQENLDFRFLTNNTQRMVIKNAGRVGINTNLPGNRLEITSATGDPYFGGASSGLRFTNMTSASPTLANPSNKVLSVDANGDVVLVPDGPGGGGGGTTSVTAQNGLTNLSPSVIEWGGTLLHDTYIDQANHNIWWHNQGVFTLGSALPLTVGASYKAGFTNNNYDISHYIENLNIPTSSSSPAQIGLQIKNSSNNTGSGKINLGVYSTVSGSDDTRNLFQTDPSNIFGFGTTVVPNSVSEAVNAISYNGNIAIGGAFSAATNDPSAIIQYGVEGQVFSGDNCRGLYGIVWNGGGASSTSYGAKTENFASNGTCYGIETTMNPATPNISSSYYGIKATVNAPGAGLAYAGYFDGDVHITGNITGTQYGFSDQTLKTSVNTITNAKSIISQLQPKSFYFDTTKYFLKEHSSKNYGLLAQQVQTVLPELVSIIKIPNKVDSLGNIVAAGGAYKSLNYEAFIGILLANAKEQNARIDSLISALGSSARAANPNTTSNEEGTNPSNTAATKDINKHNITLSNADKLVLDQNQPNPFNESTVINYNVPEKYGYAQIIFTTNEGKIMKIVDITKKGRGEITVYANDLSAGIYQYSLVVDGKTIESKKMIKQ